MGNEHRFRVIIAGSRGFNDYGLLCQLCDEFFLRRKPTAIVCGEANGADKLGRQYAEEHDITVMSFPADWSQYGRAAGHIRNKEMLGVADALIAFWDGRSSGTKNMIDISKERGIPYRIVMFEDEFVLVSTRAGIEVKRYWKENK